MEENKRHQKSAENRAEVRRNAARVDARLNAFVRFLARRAAEQDYQKFLESKPLSGYNKEP